mgnify:CR=1 FL=1
MGFNFLAPFILLLILSCGGMKQSGSEENLKDFQKLSELVNSREFEIENEWLMPLGGSMINLIGNPNYIRFKADSVDVFLPYFGVRQSGGGYGGNGGITYTGPVKDLEISEGAANKNIQLNFSGKHNSENLEFFITLYQGGSVTTLVSSSQRQSISYRGNVKPLPEEGQ